MKGDIAFVGFMLTADEWQALDAESRAALIAVATRRTDAFLPAVRRLAEGTGKHEVLDIIDAELDELIEPDLEMEAALAEDAAAAEGGEVFENFEDWTEL